jgi:tetratricopeptide (TPR) repeat protein
VGLLTLLLVVILYRRKIDFKKPFIRFLLITCGCYLLFTFIVDAKLGPSRDWDLLSIPSIPYTLLCGYLLVRCVKDRGILKSAGLILVTVAAIHAIPWFLINADAGRSIQRFKLLIKTGAVRSLAYAHEELAVYYRERGLLNQASDEFEQAVSASPENRRLRSSLGSLYLTRKMYDQAIRQYDAAVRLDPNDLLAHYNLGCSYLFKNQFEPAIEHFRKVVTINPRFAEAHYNLAMMYQKLGQSNEAIQEYKEAIDISPQHAGYHFALGCAYELEKMWSEAKKEWLKTLEIDPQHQGARNKMWQLRTGELQ